MRVTRAKVVETMWANGRPSTDSRYADVYFAALKAGLDSQQALTLACAAYDAAQGFVERLSSSTAALRCATLERKAADPTSPRSLWAYLRVKFGCAYRYITDQQIHETSVGDYAGWSAWAKAQETEAAA